MEAGSFLRRQGRTRNGLSIDKGTIEKVLPEPVTNAKEPGR